MAISTAIKSAGRFRTTLLLALIALVLSVRNHFGFLLAFLVAVLLVCFIVSAVLMLRRPAQRRDRAIRMVIWTAVVAIAGMAQAYWSSAARTAADSAAHAVVAFKAAHGRYPASLVEIGINETALRDEWMLVYAIRDGQPLLAYASTYLPIDAYEFDFDRGEWKLDSY